MNRYLLLLLFPLLALACGDTTTANVDSTPDPVTSVKPPVTRPAKAKMTPVFHAAVVLEYDDQTIFVDPYDKPAKFTAFGKPDLVLITHTHQDHFNREVLAALDLGGATLIGPAAVVEQAADLGFDKITVLKNGERVEMGDMAVDAVAAYNLPPAEDAFHPPGKFNGYVLTLGDERFYFSGDTEDVDEMRALRNIDYAFVCMNQPYTMEVAAAADAVLDFKPRVVYPYHYRNGDGSFMDTEEFAGLVRAGDKTIEVRVLDWYKE